MKDEFSELQDKRRCVNPTVRLFCFLAPPPACYFGIIKESFPRYHSQPRWPRFYLREAASQRWDLELLNGLSFCPHIVCIWNVNDCRMQEGAPSSNKKKERRKSNQIRTPACGENAEFQYETLWLEWCVRRRSCRRKHWHHSSFFFSFFCIFWGVGFFFCISFSASLKTWQLGLAECDMFISLLDTRRSGRVWVGWLRSKWPSRGKQQSAPKHIGWLKEEPRQEEGGRNGMWQQMWGCKKKNRRTGASQRQVGWSPDRGKVK